jgi:peptidyl-prolyl cis-trans isomerase A (cyclophilin A)
MDRYAVELDTTRGKLVIDVEPEWAPLGAARFHELVSAGFYDDVAFFRVVPGFVAQAGLSGDPSLNKKWRDARIKDDASKESNLRGTVTFATSGPNARTTQFFINLRDNTRLDAMGFAPFGRVRDMAIADALHAEYGDSPPGGRGPMQGRIQREGNAYLRAEFPDLDYVRAARIL